MSYDVVTGESMRDKVSVLYYPDFVAAEATFKKAVLLFDEIHFMDRPSYTFGGRIGTIGMHSPLRSYEASFRDAGVSLYVHAPMSGRVSGSFHEAIAADINDREYLRRFQKGLSVSQAFRNLHIAQGEYGDSTAPGKRWGQDDVARSLGALDLGAAFGTGIDGMGMLADSETPIYALSDPSSCTKTFLLLAATCSAKMNDALQLSATDGFVPLADVVTYGELLGVKYQRAVGKLNAANLQVPITDLTFSVFDELVPSGLLESLTIKQIVQYRASSVQPREAFLEYVSALQARVGDVRAGANYADSIGKLVQDEVLPAAREYRNKLAAIADSLFGNVAKGAIGAVGAAVGSMQLLGDLSLEHILGWAALGYAYVGKATVDGFVQQRAVKRESALSYVLNIDS